MTSSSSDHRVAILKLCHIAILFLAPRVYLKCFFARVERIRALLCTFENYNGPSLKWSHHLGEMWVRATRGIQLKISRTLRAWALAVRGWSTRIGSSFALHVAKGLTTGIISRRARCNLRSKFLMIFNQADAAVRSLRLPPLPPKPRLLPLSFLFFSLPPFRGKSFFLGSRSAKIFPRARIINSVLRGALNSSGNRCSYVLSPSLSSSTSSISSFSRDRATHSPVLSSTIASRLLRLVCIYYGPPAGNGKIVI